MPMTQLELMEFIDTALDEEKSPEEVFYLFREAEPDEALGKKKAPFVSMVGAVANERQNADELGPLFVEHRKLQRTRRLAVIKLANWLANNPPTDPSAIDEHVNLAVRAQESVGDMAKTSQLKFQLQAAREITDLPSEVVDLIDLSFTWETDE